MSNESTIQREMRKSKREKERVRDPPSLRDGIPWDKEQRQESQVGDCSKENALDNWHPPTCPFPSMENRQLGNKCAFWHAEQGWRRTEETNEFCGSRQNSGKVTSLKVRAKGDLLHGVSAIPVRSKFQKIERLLSNSSESERSATTSNSEFVQLLLKHKWNALAKKHGM